MKVLPAENFVLMLIEHNYQVFQEKKMLLFVGLQFQNAITLAWNNFFHSGKSSWYLLADILFFFETIQNYFYLPTPMSR